MNADDVNAIITGGSSTLPTPSGGPSNTPAPTGVSDPTATADPGPGTGAPTPMPKQDSGSRIDAMLGNTSAIRRAIYSSRENLDKAHEELAHIAAELVSIQRNPPDRKLRADQSVFFPRLLSLIQLARLNVGPGGAIASELAEAEWIVTRIQQL